MSSSNFKKSIPTPKSINKSPLKPENFDNLTEEEHQEYITKYKQLTERLQLKAKEEARFKELQELIKKPKSPKSKKSPKSSKHKGGRSRNRKSRRAKNNKNK